MLNQAYPLPFDISDFSLGWDNINKPTTLNKKTFTDIKNFNLTRRRGLEKRGGISDLYSTTAGASTDITSLYEYKAPDGNDYILTAIGTKVRAYYNAKWNDLKTGLTTGKKYNFETYRGLCYIANGTDDNFKLRNTTSYDLGIEPPLGAPSVATAAPGAASLYTNWGTSNIDYIGELRQNASRTQIAQAFMLDMDSDLTKVVLKLKKIGSPTGDMLVEIHSDQEGTQVGGDSDGVTVSGLDGTLTSTDFDFSGTAPSLSKNTTYYIIIKDSGDMSAVSSTNFVEVGFDWNGGYIRGAYHEIDGSDAWTAFNDTCLGFEIHGSASPTGELVNYGAILTGDFDMLRSGTSNHLLSQSFQITANSYVATVKLPLSKLALPKYAELSGNLWVEIHSSKTGTSATKSASTNLVTNATSDNVNVSTGVSYDSEWITFTFSTVPSLTASTTYYLVLYCNFTAGNYHRLLWAVDDSGYSSGESHWIDSSMVWTDKGEDFSFQVLGYATAAGKREEHSLSDIIQIRDLRETTSQQMIVQSFTVDETGSCPYAKIYMSKTGSPTGNVWAEIHSAQDGTSASKDSSTYIVGSASANVDVSGLDAFPTFGWQTFTFGTTDPPLNAGSTYYLVIYGDYTVSTTALANIALDKVPPGYLNGRAKWEINTSEAWAEVPGQDIIFEIYLTTTGLADTYYYCYTYKRTEWLATESNPSDISDSIVPATQDIDVSVVASTDTQVDKIILYRTLAGETSPFYKQGEYANSTATITDSVSDNGLTTLYDTDNDVPPKAMFIKLHGNRIFYANCPDEDEGKSLVKWSKSGNGEVVPSINYHYFDRNDGEDITGIASLGTNLFIFKPNKIGILNIDSPELWYLSFGIGCIAPWAILTFKDKIIFLSEEGWKATDGTDIWDLSENINGLIEDEYLTINEKENYSVAYYPEKEHFQFLINHSTEDPLVVVGHFLVPLLLKPTGVSELVKQEIMGWTYHQYDYNELTCISNYTDSNGITRVIAGASNGFVYLLDSGADDDGEDVTTRLRTDWLSLDTPRSITKTIRKGYLVYGTSGTISLDFTVDIDFTATDETSTLTGSDVDLDDSINESFDLTGTGELFRFTLLETSSKSVDIMGLTIMYRIEGAR